MTHGPLNFTESAGVRAARLALGAEKRPPREDDRPPPSLFTLTRAAKVARQMSRESNKGREEGF